MQKGELITIENNEEFLRKISTEVDIKNDKELVSDLNIVKEYCLSHEVLAMAAIQLSISKRLLYVKNTDVNLVNKFEDGKETEELKNHDESIVMINSIIKKREGLTSYWEACQSCLEYCGLVLRPYRIEVEFYDINGNKYEEVFEGFPATVISHEYDHLNGIIHPDIALKCIKMNREKRIELREVEDYTVLNENGDYEQLKNNIKDINEYYKLIKQKK